MRPTPRRRSRARKARERDLKDRLVQTRVPERLESVLKEEAKKRRLSVSHFIRNVLEDTLQLVDTVVTGGEELVGDSVRLAEQVARDAGKIASPARRVVGGRGSQSESKAPVAVTGDGANLEHVLAWNGVVLNRSQKCSQCGTELPKGGAAHLGVSQDPSAAPAWLCDLCLKSL